MISREWNYRVIKTLCPHTGEQHFQVHEAYYRPGGMIDCWNQQAIAPQGYNAASLRNDIQAFLRAFRLPVLTPHFINDREHLTQENASKASPDLQSDYPNKASRATAYLIQILGHHLLLKQEPALRATYEHVDQALMTCKKLPTANCTRLMIIAEQQHD